MPTSRLYLASLLLAVGCEPAELTFPGSDLGDLGNGPGEVADSDGDGLTDDEEAELGSDPDSADTDFDGWDDYEEFVRNTDPTDGTDKPYTGGWPIGDCRDDIQADSTLSEGGIAPDFELVDMYGDTVRLHDFCHMAILVVSGFETCPGCVSYRDEMGRFMDEYFDRGLMVIDFLGQTASGGEITDTDLVRWADGHYYAVLADPNWGTTSTGYDGDNSYPSISLLGPGAEVIKLDSGDSDRLIEDNLPEGFVLPDYVLADMEEVGAR